MPDTTTTTKRPGRPTKTAISIRLTDETLRHYRRTGKGWQTRLSADLDRLARRRAERSR
jgi:uncharacterized protein (DUF4415 family)